MATDYACCGITRKREFRDFGVPRAGGRSDVHLMSGRKNPLSPEAKRLQRHLTAWRKSRNLTLEKLAEHTGNALSTLSGWENGSREVGTDDLVKLAALYGVHPAALMLAPEEAGPKIERMIKASGIAERLDDAKAEQWLGLGSTLAGDPPQK